MSTPRTPAGGLFLVLTSFLLAGSPAAADGAPSPRNPRDVASLEALIETARRDRVPFRLSLADLARDSAAAERAGGLTKKLRQMRGFNWVYGFALDRASGDVLLLGFHDPARPPLDVDCWVSALRAVWAGKEPFCSLDPDPDPRYQKSVIGGIDWESRAAAVLIAADYAMKSIALGQEDPGIPGLRSWVDRVADNRRDGEASQMCRWWFSKPTSPVPHTLVVDGDVVVLTRNPVLLKTELARGKQFGTGQTSPEAEAFAADFTRGLPALAARYPSIARLLALYRLVDLAAHLKHFLSEADLPLPGQDYWLTGYRSPYPGPPRQVPSLTRQLTFAEADRRIEMKVTGGVRIGLELDSSAFQRVRRPALRDRVLEAAPDN
jgi:hypothetical protein